MSRSLTLKALAVVICGTAAGAAGAWSLQGKHATIPLDRRIASLPAEADRPPLMIGKHLSVVQVSVEAPDGIPDSEEWETRLIGWIRLNQPLTSELRYRWDVPANVHVVSGAVEDSLANVPAGQTVKVELTVTGFSKEELRLIALHGYVEAGDTRLGNSAVLTSRPQDSFEMLNDGAAFAGAASAPKARPLLKGKIIR